MPRLYQGECTNCSYKTASSYSGYLKVRLDDGEFETQHPGRGNVVNEAREMVDKAQNKKLEAWVNIVSCPKCGQIAEQYKLTDKSTFFASFSHISISYGLALCFLRGPLIFRFLVGVALMCLMGIIYEAWLQRIHKAEREALPQLTSCSNCGGRKFRNIQSGSKFTCPQCKLKTLNYTLKAIDTF